MSRPYPENDGGGEYFRGRLADREVRDPSPYYLSGGGGVPRTYGSGPNNAHNADFLSVPRAGVPQRPRSTPPYALAVSNPPRHSSRRGYDDYNDDEEDNGGGGGGRSRRGYSPASRARNVLDNTFSQSSSGLGVGILGAIVGGLAAREASEAADRAAHKGRRDADKASSKALLSTIVGAAVGGLGANALEKRLELSREKTKIEQERWEKKFRRSSGGGARPERDVALERQLDRDRDLEEGRRTFRRRADDYSDDETDPDDDLARRPRHRRSEDGFRARP
ncbi:hypothetical protein VTK73DRAFT_5416 [Phialemonium thermophilum]|uniref:Glycine zipper 2TM domain-containing protein n=1 Tax=Phialemonium thermophilum TaxID=223376 RepID=A0ABR3WNL9_9PEZI